MGSVGFLVDFEFYMAVLGVPSGPIGLVAPLRFKILDSQPVKSDMILVPTHVHDFRHFQKSYRGLLAQYLSYFELGRPQNGFSSCAVGTRKIGDKKLRRFVVVSP